MTAITIPRSITTAQARLTELGELATATEGHRAAIVAAYVNPREGQGRRTSADIREGLESATAFARRGIVGLTNHETVLVYARAWLDRFDRPMPGRKVALPTESWPPTAPDLVAWTVHDPDRRERLTTAAAERGVGASKVLDVASNPKAVAAALDADPEFREKVAKARVVPVADLPPAPFDTPPAAFPSAGEAEVRMDILGHMATLHHQILLQARHVREHPDFMREPAQYERLEHEAELLRMVAESAKGMTDTELEKLLAGDLS
jgi:hypothetical protein